MELMAALAEIVSKLDKDNKDPKAPCAWEDVPDIHEFAGQDMTKFF